MNFSNAKIKFHPGIRGLKTSFQSTASKRLIINQLSQTKPNFIQNNTTNQIYQILYYTVT